MHLKEQWIREGFSSYYVVKKEQKLTYEKNILYNHTLPCLLPCEFRIEDGEEYYYYETGIYTKLKDRISMLEPKLFFAYLLEVFEQVASYLLELDHLKLDLESMFLDKENRPVLCYLPEYEKKIDEQLRDFIEECIEYISGDDKKRVRFYYEFHSFLIKEKPNMEQMKDYLEVRSEKMNGEILREKIKNENYTTRLIVYLLGLFIMTLGISMSVKSDLGVSPVSSIPYTITCITGLEMGKATIVFHIALVALQIVILRGAFQIKNLLQVVVGVVFGYFTTFSNYLFSFLPTPDNLAVRLVMMLGSTVLIACGIFFYLPADIIPLAGEGAMKAISDTTNALFSKVKIGFDVTMAAVSLTACLIILKKFSSVGVGTVIAAVLVGAVLGVLNNLFGEKRDLLLAGNSAE